MALTKVINDLADLNQSGSTNALKGCAGTTAQQPASSSSIEYLIVGGGGAGGRGSGGGGGGAGGYVIGTGVNATTVYHGTPTVITIGEGGEGSSSTSNQYTNGDDSGFNGIRAIGGGVGGFESSNIESGIQGGSGGGGCYYNSGVAGSGTTLQGNAGGIGGSGNPDYTGGGGGGSGNPAQDTNGIGQAGGSSAGGPGTGTGGGGGSGTDITSFISVANANLAQIGDTSNTTQVFIAGGGGGGSQNSGSSGIAGTGGAGGGGNGMTYNNIPGEPPAAVNLGGSNTGGGGGGGNNYSTPSPAGGSGVAVLKYDNTIVTGYTLNSEDTYTVNWPADKYGVAYWPLNLNAKDVGGNYDGTATDITYTNGQFNQAAVFNGTTSKIQITSPLGTAAGNENDNFSVSMWVKWDSVSSAASGLHGTLVGDYTGSNYGSFHIYVYGLGSGNGLALSFERYFNSTGYYNSSYLTVGTLSTLEADMWYNITHTYVGSSKEVKLYLDGTLIATYTLDSSAGGRTTNVYNVFGDYNNSGGYGHAGSIEQIRFYGSELSLTDVQDIYNNSKPGSLPPLKTSSDLTTTICNFPSGTTGTALYQFNDNVDDSCTVGPYNGTAYNLNSYVTGKFGKAASFNGSSSYITVGNVIPNTDTDVTISAWVKLSSGVSSNMNITGTGITTALSEAPFRATLSYQSANTFKIFALRQIGGTYYYAGTGGLNDVTINAGTWYHVVWSYNSTGRELSTFLNGTAIDTGVAMSTTGSSVNDSSTAIGSFRSSSGPFFDGEIDQLRIYNTKLTAQQIYDLWQKENDTQTYFPNSSTDTDTLVFKSGSGEITFKNDTPPGAEIGMLRYNSTLGQMEHFNSGGWKDFTNITQSVDIEYVVVGGGGGGGATFGGGGGAGGFSTSTFTANSGIVITITVGVGGTGATVNTNNAGSGGSSSIVGTGINISVDGGGAAGSCTSVYPSLQGGNGGSSGASGGGGSGFRGGGTSTGGGSASGNGDGNAGGAGVSSTYDEGGGGGGSTGAGANGNSGLSNGGDGTANSITGTSVVYSAGGGGNSGYGGNTGASGGNGSDPAYGGSGQTFGNAGNANTGTGGGGGSGGSSAGYGGAGGSGVVILKITNAQYSGTLTGSSYNVDTSSVTGYTIVSFNANGTYTL